MADPQGPIIDPSDSDPADPPEAIIELTFLYPSLSDCLLDGEGKTEDAHAAAGRQDDGVHAEIDGQEEGPQRSRRRRQVRPAMAVYMKARGADLERHNPQFAEQEARTAWMYEST